MKKLVFGLMTLFLSLTLFAFSVISVNTLILSTIFLSLASIAAYFIEKLYHRIFDPTTLIQSTSLPSKEPNLQELPASLLSKEPNIEKIHDFTSKIILVHGLARNPLVDLISQFNENLTVDAVGLNGTPKQMQAFKTFILESDIILSPNGTIAPHLDLKVNQYANDFVDRPHIHWWWNGLFQGNSGGNWEDSVIAYFDPLNGFNQVMSCAPYDTMTMGPHTLSSESCILVPLAWVEPLKAKLKDYKGKILGFDPTKTSMREAINQTLQEQYPHHLKLCDAKGVDINEGIMSPNLGEFNRALAKKQDYNCSSGYFNQLFFKGWNNERFPLMTNANNILMDLFKQYAQGRYMGLHQGSPTDKESDRLIKILKALSQKPEKINEETYKKHCIGATQISDLCVFTVFSMYQKLMEYDSKTGLHDYARYVLTKAFIADYRSLYGLNSDIHTIKLYIDIHYDHLLSILNNNATDTVKEYKAFFERDQGLVCGPELVDLTPRN